MKNFVFIITLLLVPFFFSCNKTGALFQLIPSSHSNIHFNNRIVENDSINPIDLTNMYNGGGIGVADFNKDGLQDIYFTGNQVGNKLYLNKGNLIFEDVTDASKAGGDGKWCRGVAVVDINNDGWEDIYVCATLVSDAKKRENLLYINSGVNKDNIPVFKEMAAEYGLNDTSHSTMASFFDFDNDGDLDVYITVNEIIPYDNPSVYRNKIKDGSFASTGKLYRNEWDKHLNHPVFKDCTKEAGVTIEGYSHATSIADINKDGWKDIFVTNDFLSNDLLYINNHDATFTDKAASYFKHTSANGMGQDVIDINNDGLADIIEVDMEPEDNYRKKLLMSANNYRSYQNNDSFGYQYQYVRNTLQLNQGPRVDPNNLPGDPIFSDVGYFAGISSTDWSWAPLVQDFDNDGMRDIVITNGYPKDLTDHDFIAFREKSFMSESKSYVLSQLPEVKISNYAFRNNGDVTFSNVTGAWGLIQPSFSNGAAYADLDNDGDVDVIMNNINDEAFIYKNTLMEESEEKPHYLSVNLVGDSLNINGLGTWIELYYNGKRQVLEQSPYRGYLSTMQRDPHFGLGDLTTIDTVIIKWPDLKQQVFLNVPADQPLVAMHTNATSLYTWNNHETGPNSLFKNVTDSLDVRYQDKGKDFVDFDIQTLLPHKFSEYGPALAAGDINGDGLEDIVIGGSFPNAPTLLLQQKTGSFIQKNTSQENAANPGKLMGICLFDADNDGDLDIYAAGGGYAGKPNSDAYRDFLYRNDGKGNFEIATDALPLNYTSKSCVRAADFDKDGDLDFFVAGRVEPWNYPNPASCFIYRNDSRDGKIKFTDITASAAPSLVKIGLTCDALWTDFNNDGWQDLVIVGEWMPITFLQNDHGHFRDITPSSGISRLSGWWNSIACGDFDNDGDMDYVAGNLGENSFYRASDKYPVSIYARDFNKNGVTQCIVTRYLPDKPGGILKKFTSNTRDEVVEQLPFIKKRFLTYKDFANASFDKIFTSDEIKEALKDSASYFKSSFIRNDGNGNFTPEALPGVAQFSAINGMVIEDFDLDGYLDICMNTNDYSTEPSHGRYDALNGLVLKGDGKGNFKPLSMMESGIFIPGNGKALVKFRSSNENCMVAASENKGPLKIFRISSSHRTVLLNPTDVNATILYKDGRRQKREINYGSSFLSQSGRFLNVDDNISSVEIENSRGETRLLNMQ